MIGRATFDRSGVYRYTLHRRWVDLPGDVSPGSARPPARSMAPMPAGGTVCFCLLNPSTADARVLDPTLTRCLGFAKRWGFGSMEVVNIFALRSTDPAGLRRVDDPVGPGNDAAIRRAARRADAVVVGWGGHGTLGGRDERVRRLLLSASRRPTMCWGLTKTGQPKHPLYLASTTELRLFAP